MPTQESSSAGSNKDHYPPYRLNFELKGIFNQLPTYYNFESWNEDRLKLGLPQGERTAFLSAYARRIIEKMKFSSEHGNLLLQRIDDLLVFAPGTQARNAYVKAQFWKYYNEGIQRNRKDGSQQLISSLHLDRELTGGIFSAKLAMPIERSLYRNELKDVLITNSVSDEEQRKLNLPTVTEMRQFFDETNIPEGEKANPYTYKDALITASPFSRHNFLSIWRDEFIDYWGDEP